MLVLTPPPQGSPGLDVMNYYRGAERFTHALLFFTSD
jgi:hypothetical protein